MRVLLLIALSFATATAAPSISPQRAANLTIVVDNVRDSKGVVGALVFQSARGWPESVAAAVRKTSVPAHRGLTTLTFANLPLGSYAIVVLHDENENMKLDRNAFGKPKEGWGMSNNPKAHMAAPPFAAARFTLRDNAKIAVHLRY